MNVNGRLSRAERQLLHPSGKHPLVTFVEQSQRLDRWLASHDLTAREALAAGLTPPPELELPDDMLEIAVVAEEQGAVFDWFSSWKIIVDTRKRIADPRFGGDCPQNREQLQRAEQSAERGRAKMAEWGINLEDALEIVKEHYSQTFDNGYKMPADELESIVAAIRSAEASLSERS